MNCDEFKAATYTLNYIIRYALISRENPKYFMFELLIDKSEKNWTPLEMTTISNSLLSELSNGHPPTRTVKLTLLGEAAVGKSSIALRFVKNAYHPTLESTIGASFLTDSFTTLSGERIRLEIWDTAGQERFKALAPMYYRNTQIALIVLDVSSQKSFDRAKKWVTEIQGQATPSCVIGLAANKVDVDQDKRQVDASECRDYAENHNLFYMETSAKTGQNITLLFQELAKLVPQESSEIKPSTFAVAKDAIKEKDPCCVIS